jgi:transposase InsO family protein
MSGTFYYLCSVLDGYSRLLVHWELRQSMTEAEIEIVLQRAREKYPEPERDWRIRYTRIIEDAPQERPTCMKYIGKSPNSPKN